MSRKLFHSPAALLFFLFLLCSLPARADKVDDYVRAQMQERHIPGAAIAVVKDGRIVKAEGYGLANVELNVPATKETVFEIGSVTKQITAAAIMLLVEEGKINADEKIGKYLPDTPQLWSKVTVRHLLTHTSGVKSYTGLSGFELTKRLPRLKSIALTIAKTENAIVIAQNTPSAPKPKRYARTYASGISNSQKIKRFR
jgi:CubicO group peptidase (beta-lactamase class C family)